MTKCLSGVVVATLLVGGLVGLGAVSSPNTAVDNSQRVAPLAVSTLAVEPRATFSMQRTFTGVVRAARVSELGFERLARLEMLAVDEGDRVAEGQTLARLDSRNLDARRSELLARKRAAEALLAEFEAGPRKQTIAATRAEVNRLQAEFELKKVIHARNTSLITRNAISTREFDQSKFEEQAAEAAVEYAKQTLAELVAGTRDEQITAQRAVVAQLDASISDVEIDIEQSVLAAPFSGTVAKRYHDQGTVVPAGEPLFRLVESDRLEAWIGMPVEFARRFVPGQHHTVELGHRQVPAVVRTVLPELDATTRTRMVVFKFESTVGPAVVPSQMVRVRVAQEKSTEGFWLPNTSLARGSRGLWSVYALERSDEIESVVSRRDVEVLYTDSDRAFVRGALGAGDLVVESGTHRIVVGQRVTGLDANDPRSPNSAK